jgi:predicted glycoside hydrolase/deacetylase ChbG (UPF0249 family)
MTGTLELIVNADDFGISEAVNRGVVEAHERGIVTSASLMAAGPAFDDAVELARRCPRLAVGVHLTLTEQQPLTETPSLLTAEGALPAHTAQLLKALFRKRVLLPEVHRELDAQIRRVLAAGIRVSHLDGHQHVHVLPGVARVVAELAQAHGIRFVRYPAERVRGYMLSDAGHARRVAEQVALQFFCARSPLKRWRRSDEFVGFYFGGRLDEANLVTALRGLPSSGCVELMCHPGADDMRPVGGWQYSWAAERNALTSERIRALVAERGVRLVAQRGS